MYRFKNFIDKETDIDENTRFIIKDDISGNECDMSIRNLLSAIHSQKSIIHDYECMLDGCIDGAEICKCAECHEYFYVEDCTQKNEWGKPICDECYDALYGND